MSEPTDRPWLERDRRPSGVSDETVSAVGKFSEALEWVERARGHLYDFHQMMGHADALIGEAADELREAGHQDQAQRIEAELVGRNALEGLADERVHGRIVGGGIVPDLGQDGLVNGKRDVLHVTQFMCDCG